MAERNRLAALIGETTGVLVRAETLRLGLQQCTEILVRNIDAAFARIWTLNAADGVLELQASAGIYTHIDGGHARVPVGKFKIGHIAREGVAHLTNEVLEDPLVADKEWARREGMVAFAGYPLMVEERVVGVVAAFACQPFAEETIQAFAAVAGGVAQFIERKRTETALRESEATLHLLLDSTAEAIYGTDLDGNCTLANRACLRMLRYESEKELVGRNMHGVIHHSRADGSAYPIAECRPCGTFRTGQEIHTDQEVLWRRDNTSFPAEYWSYPMWKDGEIVGAVVTFLDVTLRRQAEEEQRKLVSLVENSDDFIAMASPQGTVVYLNQAGARLVGLDSPQEALDLSLFQFHTEPMALKIQQEVIPAAMNTGNWQGELQLRHFKTAATIDVLVNAFVLRRPENGEILCTAAVMRDITERKRAEDSLRRAVSAEAANRLKSEFLANMSHEFRTPMNGIIGMTDLALETELTSEQREYLQTVRHSADKLLIIINDVLHFSKIESGKLDLNPIDLDLRESLEDWLKLLAPAAHRKGLAIVSEVSKNVPSAVQADPKRLEQVLNNLVDNAIKFTSEGEIAIRVTSELESEHDVLLHFEVQDTGIGIPQDKQQIIFEAFSQADGSTTRSFGGAGLGLTIAAKLIGMMRGRIWVASEVGKGSSFHFTVPFKKAQQDAVRGATQRDEMKSRI